MLNLSKNPALSFERLLVYSALGYYVFRQITLRKSGALGGDGEESWMIKVDKEKMLKHAEKHFKMNPLQKAMMEQAFEHLVKGKSPR